MNKATFSPFDIETAAQLFATAAHAATGKLRNYTNLPYITHPAAVVEILKGVHHAPVVLAGGWLHDVVEDTSVTEKLIRSVFGDETACLVEGLTDISRPADGNRAARKKIDREHIAQGSIQVKTIKLADLIDNSIQIIEHDPAFAKVYIPEKALLLDVLTDGDPILFARAEQIVRAYLDSNSYRC